MADISFAQVMIIHYEGATDLAGRAEQTSSTGQVRELAARINAAQGPEISTMRGWLTAAQTRALILDMGQRQGWW